MGFLDSIDPFLLQLVIIPIIVIGVGVSVAIIKRKFYIRPIITLILNGFIEICIFNTLSSWCIIFSILSLVLSFLLVKSEKFDY